jgi:hypothetical protein
MVSGKGPKILRPLTTSADIIELKTIVDADAQVPFLRPILEVTTEPSLHTLLLDVVYLLCCDPLFACRRSGRKRLVKRA